MRCAQTVDLSAPQPDWLARNTRKATKMAIDPFELERRITRLEKQMQNVKEQFIAVSEAMQTFRFNSSPLPAPLLRMPSP